MLRIDFARGAGIALLLALSGSSATAGDVRHLTIPKAVWGTWALKPDQCAANDAPLISIGEGGGTGPEDNCAVQYVVETAGAAGPIYSAHMVCTEKDNPAKSSSKAFIVIPRGDDSMSVGSDFDNLKTYYRCPDAN
ncbi:MAG: hypothetical protein JO134_16875 [Xanthobacteraceae bacterium]|nr:hypothetical protein [Xanthobacteraceae bacterium]